MSHCARPNHLFLTDISVSILAKLHVFLWVRKEKRQGKHWLEGLWQKIEEGVADQVLGWGKDVEEGD